MTARRSNAMACSAARLGAALTGLTLLASALAACSGDRTGLAFPGANAPAAPARPSPPPMNMAGRWVLMSPGQGQCNMTFGAAPGAAEGTIAPEGGCPGQFYTSRKWTFDSAGLVIRNHNGESLAQLTFAGTGNFGGQSTAGEAITLTQ